MNQKMMSWLARILMSEIVDSFYGHRGRHGHRGGSVPRTEHTTKNENSQFEAEAGEDGISINKIMALAKPHKYTAKEHKGLKDRSLIVVKGSDIEGSKFGGMQLYRYNKKDKCLESTYGDNPKLYLKDLKGKEVRVFHPTSDTINKNTKHVPRKKRVAAARAEDFATKEARLLQNVPDPTTKQSIALANYTGNGYTTYNKWLRTKGVVNEDNGEIEGSSHCKDDVDRLTKYLGQAKLEEDTFLFRNCSADALDGQYEKILQSAGLSTYQDDIESCLKAIVGKVGQEMGFMSTSAEEDNFGTLRKVHFEIFAPKGTNATYVDKHSSCEGEKEVLGQRGLKLLCTGYKKVKQNGQTVYIVQQQIVN